MIVRRTALGLTLAAALDGYAAEGLTAPAAERLWPQWQARISVQTASLSPLTMSSLLAGDGAQRGLRGASVLGDYTFARPWFGSFRASGGLLIGSQAGAPLANAAGSVSSISPRLGTSFSALGTLASSGETPGTLPYVGLGFSGAAWRNSLSFSADLGVVAEHAGNAVGVGRALLGNQALDGAVRDLRLSPVLQLGVRYTF